jgi:hypothetical protein
MAKRKSAPPAPPATPDEAMPAKLADDNFVATLRQELARSQKTAEGKGGEDLAHRGELNKRLLQDLWEVHNQFEQISIHLTVEPSQTLFATFVEYPEKWSFRDSFDFGAVKTIELHDRTPGWVGFTLRFWFYRTPEGVSHLRGIYEWCEGESYHKYTGWMRMMNQAVLYDTREDDVNLRDLHAALRDLVVRWYTAHLERSPDSLIAHLKEKFPKGVNYAKESYRD